MPSTQRPISSISMYLRQDLESRKCARPMVISFDSKELSNILSPSRTRKSLTDWWINCTTRLFLCCLTSARPLQMSFSLYSISSFVSTYSGAFRHSTSDLYGLSASTAIAYRNSSRVSGLIAKHIHCISCSDWDILSSSILFRSSR